MELTIDLTLTVLNSLELPPQFTQREYTARIPEGAYATQVSQSVSLLCGFYNYILHTMYIMCL